MEYIHKCSSFSEIRDNQYCVSNTLYRCVNAISKLTFPHLLPDVVKIGMRVFKEISSIYEFRANRHKEGRRFLGR
jgi:hypothetical protein